MAYLMKTKVKRRFNELHRQISKDGLHALDVKIDEFIVKVCGVFNGHHKRIGKDVINMFKI